MFRSYSISSYVVLWLFLYQFLLSSGKLIQVQVVHRHGARAHLEKNSVNPGLESGPPLLEEGYNQAKALGSAIRNQYLFNAPLEGFEGEYKNGADIRAVSSNLERTLATSRGFLEGLYSNGSGRVPTVVFGDTEEDYMLRGYALCNQYRKNLEKFHSSSKFKIKEGETKDVREEIASEVKEDPSLKNWFNVYDKIFLSRKPYLATEVDGDVDDPTFKIAQDLVAWLEFERFGPDVAGHLVGGGLLEEMVRRGKQYGGGKSTDHRLIEYSAHYPTLLGLLTAMKLPNTPLKEFKNRIPDFTAAIIWELHKDASSKKFLRMFYYAGGTATEDAAAREFIPIAFGYPGCDDGAEPCPLATVSSSVGKSLLSDSRFCEVCSIQDQEDPKFCSSRSDAVVNVPRSIGNETLIALTGFVAASMLWLTLVLIMVRRWKGREQRLLAAWIPPHYSNDHIGPASQDSNIVPSPHHGNVSSDNDGVPFS